MKINVVNVLIISLFLVLIFLVTTGLLGNSLEKKIREGRLPTVTIKVLAGEGLDAITYRVGWGSDTDRNVRELLEDNIVVAGSKDHPRPVLQPGESLTVQVPDEGTTAGSRVVDVSPQ